MIRLLRGAVNTLAGLTRLSALGPLLPDLLRQFPAQGLAVIDGGDEIRPDPVLPQGLRRAPADRGDPAAAQITDIAMLQEGLHENADAGGRRKDQPVRPFCRLLLTGDRAGSMLEIPLKDIYGCGRRCFRPESSCILPGSSQARGIRLDRHRLDRRAFQDLRAEPAQAGRCLRDQLLRAGDQDLFAGQRTVFRPGKAVREGTDPADDDDGRRPDPRARRFLRQGGYGRDDPALPGCGPPLKHSCRHVRLHACLQQAGRDRGKGGHAHQKDQRSAQADQGFVIDSFTVFTVFSPVACDDVHTGREVPVRHRDSIVGRHREGAGDAGHHFVGDPVFRQELQLLSLIPEQKGISALEPHNPAARQGLFQERPVDPVLLHQVVSRPLADIDQVCALRDQGQDLIPDQGVIDDDLRVLQDLQSH